MPNFPPGTPPELIEYMGNFPMFSDEQVNKMMDLIVVRKYSRGAILQMPGDPTTTSYVVLKGCVREYVLIDGNDRSTAFFTEHESINSFASLSNPPVSDSFLECVEDCTLGICEEDIQAILVKMIPQLEELIMESLEQENLKYNRDRNRYIASTPKERYLFLQENRPELLQRVPQHQIASYIGVSPETLSRIRKRMAEGAGKA